MTLKNIIEALVFASQKPLMPKEIVQALRSAASDEDAEAKEFAKVKEPEVVAQLELLKTDYLESGRAFQLVEQVSGWQVVTAPECGKWVRQLYPESKPARLSGPALETLAIVAYRQPITKADIEAVRGVAVDGMMQMLLEKGLLRIAGRADVPGRPLLYETTEYFLEHFGLHDVTELPNSEELRRVQLPTAPVIPVEATVEKPATEKSVEESSKELPLTEEPQPPAGDEQPPEEEEHPVEEQPLEETPVDEPPASEETSEEPPADVPESGDGEAPHPEGESEPS